jgi:FKBP-type peptidyl-prolyl cis-trans isomerase|tara:strand:- start:716 stop:1033 length:318 start_codon:yes stop_codon:yes gene_type:complete
VGELKKWRDQKWVRIDGEGNIVGECGTSPDKKNPDRCLPLAKARSLSKAERAATANKKKKSSKTVVKNTKKATVKNMFRGGEVRQEIAKGCGAVLDNRRKVTKHM